ncbi:MAG: glucose-6-phosphate isomerase, partial [Mogibacterium sp.]|nr:glucose-6-phosphate isomerase [Mogibacterium sp.]
TDLHSMGQYLQQGPQIFFETILNVVNRDKDVKVPESAGPELAGRSLNDINAMAVKGVMAAHAKADIPMIKIDIEEVNEYSLGQLLYFLMMTSAVTGKLMGIDPFNQPGVEDYKQEIRNLLGQ